MSYQVVHHPRSGEAYVVLLDRHDVIRLAAGPLHWRDAERITEEEMEQYMANQDQQDASADAVWLRAELASGTR